MGRLEHVDLTQTLSPEEQDQRLLAAGKRLVQLRLKLGGLLDPANDKLGPPICVVFEGWDASGKGGSIKRLVTPLDPRHVRVRSIAAPTTDEKRHHFLLRFSTALPGWGGMTVLDRSWYGRVLVERVEGFATETQWRRAYKEIADFEQTLVAEGMILIKFWMHISQEEQLSRFQRREKDPLKRWKLTDEDWRNRKKYSEYLAAVEEMFLRTDIPEAPWQIVAGNCKRFARVSVLETVINEIERGLRERGFEVPAPMKKK